MGKKTTSSTNKSKEKRQARKLEQRRIADGMSFVTSANKLTDMASLCKELLVYQNKDLQVDMYIRRVTDLDKDVLNWALSLTERNMKKLFPADVTLKSTWLQIHKALKLSSEKPGWASIGLYLKRITRGYGKGVAQD